MMATKDEAAPASPRLDGARILVVEDDFLIGLELAAVLSDAGAEVVGPSQSVAAAMMTAEEPLSAAILDMRLGEETVAPVARLLAARHVPFLFYTGQSETDPLRCEWPECRILAKPAMPPSLVAALAALLREERQRARPAAR
jgi:DNA-binding response OmpR family regulator